MNQAKRKEEQLVRLKAQGLALHWVPGLDTVLPLLQPVGKSVGTYVRANAWISSKLFTLTWITRAITSQLGCLVHVLVSSLGPTQSAFPAGRAATSQGALWLEAQPHADPLCWREVQIWCKQVQISLKPTLCSWYSASLAISVKVYWSSYSHSFCEVGCQSTSTIGKIPAWIPAW